MSTLKIKVHTSESTEGTAFQPYEINGYLVQQPLTANDSGFSKWGYCTKFGKEFFLKEFLSPKYPKEDAPITEQQRNNRVKECNAWFQSKQEIYHRIMESASGNLVVPSDFFRFGNQFYLVTEKVQPNAIAFQDLHLQSAEQLQLLLKVLAYSFSKLEQHGVVHADVKPNNLILKSTIDGFFTVKIIDFDASFLEEKQPDPEELMGDAAYYSPEAILRMMEEEVEVTSKSDVFTLGILFHQILSGELPEIGGEDNTLSVGEAVLNEEPVTVRDTVPEPYRELIQKMLLFDVAERPSSTAVFQYLSELDASQKTWSAPAALSPEPGTPAAAAEAAKESDGAQWKRTTDLD